MSTAVMTKNICMPVRFTCDEISNTVLVHQCSRTPVVVPELKSEILLYTLSNNHVAFELLKHITIPSSVCHWTPGGRRQSI